MATYTIQVLNQSGFAKSYVIFSEPPQVTKSGESVDTFTNAWITFHNIKIGGYDRVKYDDRIDAFWGTMPVSVSPNISVSTGGFVPVDTAQQDGVKFTGTTPTGFSTVEHGVAASGSFQIQASGDFTAENHYVFGMAKPSRTPIAEPVATFLAEPNDTFDVIPVVKFYIADGSYTQGEVIDVHSFSTEPGEIDFTGRPQTTATVVQHPNGNFTVQYT